eukprot:6743939-Prymnesium_polylepis.2
MLRCVRDTHANCENGPSRYGTLSVCESRGPQFFAAKGSLCSCTRLVGHVVGCTWHIPLHTVLLTLTRACA